MISPPSKEMSQPTSGRGETMKPNSPKKNELRWFTSKWVFPKIISGTPKSAILIGFSIKHHPVWGTSIFGNPQMNLNDFHHFAPFVLKSLSWCLLSQMMEMKQNLSATKTSLDYLHGDLDILWKPSSSTGVGRM